MDGEEQIREVVERLTAQLKGEIGTEVRRLVAEMVTRERADAARAREAELAAAREEAAHVLAGRLADARAEAEQYLAAELARAQADAAQRLSVAVVGARADERHPLLVAVNRLLDAVRRLDEARSLSQVLDALAECAATEASRVAVFVLEGGRIRGWRFVGVGPDAEAVRTRDLNSREAGIIARAAETGHLTTVTGPAGLPGAPEPNVLPLPLDSVAVASPVLVDGQAVAVLYADDVTGAGRPVSAIWPQAVELLARHGGRCLEMLTAVRVSQLVAASRHPAVGVSGSTPAPRLPATPAAGTPPEVPPEARGARSEELPGTPVAGEAHDGARRYARLLVSEVKLYNEAEVKLGQQHRDLLHRLRSEIERARRLYEARIPPDVRAHTSYFDQELVRTLADGDSGALGAADVRAVE